MEKNVIDYFISLVQIDSESRDEAEIAQKIRVDLENLGAEVQTDEAYHKTRGNAGNIYAFFPGNIKKKPILFCAHLDTVIPGKSIKPVIGEDRITSDGSTILGGDDKSGIAEIIWAIKEIKTNRIEHAPLEILFTVSEEIGLLGAKYFNYTKLKSEFGYAFDGHRVGELTIAAPSQNSIELIIPGKEAHAGVEPEKGINAIKLAAEAITKMPSGRIDPETTCNIGIISGGKATNIVPNKVMIKAEARSHDEVKLTSISDKIVEVAKSVIKSTGSQDLVDKFKSIQINEYKSFKFSKKTDVVELGLKAARNIGLEPNTSTGGGGSDANIINQNNLRVVIAGSGMSNVHTVDEYILKSELEKGTRWIKEMIMLYSNSENNLGSG